MGEVHTNDHIRTDTTSEAFSDLDVRFLSIREDIIHRRLFELDNKEGVVSKLNFIHDEIIGRFINFIA